MMKPFVMMENFAASDCVHCHEQVFADRCDRGRRRPAQNA
jgi:hypothetical protein